MESEFHWDDHPLRSAQARYHCWRRRLRPSVFFYALWIVGALALIAQPLLEERLRRFCSTVDLLYCPL